jgi:predicted ribosome quality control (RQC) complex YloA/Tae2 family protein
VQPVDYTTLIAACAELQADWLPARLEQVYQRDRYHLALNLRTLQQRAWLTLSWHPQAARICMGDAPPRTPDTFTFSDQLRHQLNGLALITIQPLSAWERVVDLQFAPRPGDPAHWHLYVEIIGQYSNVILTNADNVIVTAAHQVSERQSSLRPIQTGETYTAPPRSPQVNPTLEEPFDRWHDRINLVPGPLSRNLLKPYRGLSTALSLELIAKAGLDSSCSTETLDSQAWQQLYRVWQTWLQTLNKNQFQPTWTPQGYSVLGWAGIAPVKTVRELLDRYYSQELNQQEFKRLHHQLSQKLGSLLKKLQQKVNTFQARLQQSDQADQLRNQADLLMAYLHCWQPGMTQIILDDFTTGQPITIPLQPDKSAVQNAQGLYKQHQKLKRARHAIEPLLNQVLAEVNYLSQVEAALLQIEQYTQLSDLWAVQEIQAELVQQHYLESQEYGSRNFTTTAVDESKPYRYTSPNGYEVWVGRNNRQNDLLTFRIANEYDLWFHTQEIPGSHVLLRLPPGNHPEDVDLQFTANLSAYFSRARQSDQVPVIYTEPRHVYKPKGAKPGMVIYQKERVYWGRPRDAERTVV